MFWRYCRCACAETPRILFSVQKWTSDSEPACPKNYTWGNLAPRRPHTGVFSNFVTAHAQKRLEYYFRFQNAPRIRNRHGRKTMSSEFYPKAAFLRVFWRFCNRACAGTPRMLLPVSKWTSDAEPACPITYIWGKFSQKNSS